jgi:hypothetical protein
MSGVTVLKRQCHKIFSLYCLVAASPVSFPRVLYTDDEEKRRKNQQNIKKKRNQFVSIRIYVKLERGVERT